MSSNFMSWGELIAHFLFICLLLRFGGGDAAVFDDTKYKCPDSLRLKVIFPCICTNGSNDGLYISCGNANLATLSIGLQNLAALEIPVEHLTIYKGHFVRIYGPLFSKVNVRILTIEGTPIRSIEDYAFYGMNNTLEQLYIKQSNLSSITPLAFGILGKLIHLTIDGHLMETLDKALFVGQEISNNIEVLRIANGPLGDVPIETFQPLRKLKALDLHGNLLEDLKRNQFKNLRNVESLDLSFNKIKKLEAQHISDLTKLGFLNVSHNALAEITRGSFARNSVLKVLNLSYNNITRLDVNSFRGMRFLRRLYLSDNKIYEIGRGTFGAIAKIGTIDLARNALRKIDFQMFSQLNYAEILNIAENQISLIERGSFKDIYQAQINASHNNIIKIESGAFENCVNITVLDLSFNRIENFSRNAFDVTTFATELQLSYNLFSDLGQIPLQNMTGLKVLNVSHSKISAIPKNTFPKLYELHTVDVSYNNISSIANGVFQTLFSLRSLNLSHNSLQEIKSSMFGTLPTLLEMDLSHNHLAAIVRGALAKLTSMRSLNLKHNRLEKLFQIPISLNELYLERNSITSIPPGTWPVMNSLIHLDLSENNIGDSLEANSFNGLLVLQKLLLKKNAITNPPAECLARMSTLQYLHLEHNNITTLTKSAFGKLPVLFELNLYDNQVMSISKNAFEGLLQLLVLNLSSNSLTTISNEAFLGLPSLRKLDLSHNGLTKLDNKTSGVLDDLLSLETLNLSHNKISFVTKRTFPSHQYIPYNLKYLDLSYNQMPVLTYDITFGTKKLLKLNLSNNHINEIRRGVLSNFTSLQILDISNNELTNLMSSEDIFNLPKNLTHIYLQGNQIYRMPFENLIKEVEFRVIDLRRNNLTTFPMPLLWKVRNGTEVLFAGNPTHCNCGIRPLKHFTMEQTELSTGLMEITCSTPSHISGERLVDVADDNLPCNAEELEVYKGAEYEERTDIEFRDIHAIGDGNVGVGWYVASTNDVADFNVYVRNSQNEILFQEIFPYNARRTKIRTSTEETAILDPETEVCIVAVTSDGTAGRWFSRQCRKLQVFKRPKKYSIFSRSNGSTISWGGSVVLIFCIKYFLALVR